MTKYNVNYSAFDEEVNWRKFNEKVDAKNKKEAAEKIRNEYLKQQHGEYLRDKPKKYIEEHHIKINKVKRLMK